MHDMKTWLASDEVVALSASTNWPTPESHVLWVEFNESDSIQESQTWDVSKYTIDITWHDIPIPLGTPLRLGGGPGRERSVFTADFQEVGVLRWTPPSTKGLIIATATADTGKINLEYLGPGKVNCN